LYRLIIIDILGTIIQGVPMSPLKVTLCLGSSCHSRGNRRHVETLRALLADRPGEVDFELKGSLCLGRCADGPVVLLDGMSVALGPDEDLVALIRERLDARVTP
jgi:NADH:ubiquinone oxidoreductase subunit E